jgi:hypothetical protein
MQENKFIWQKFKGTVNTVPDDKLQKNI